MATIKSYTTIKQSRKLAEFLPLESANMFYKAGNVTQPTFRLHSYGHIMSNKDVHAWSLAALLGVLPEYHLSSPNPLDSMYCCRVKDIETYANNPVDACVDMIEKLHELKML